jgi:hypothetical protein
MNEITTPDTYPLPRLEDLLNSTGQSNVISTMDLWSGYHQVQVHEPDRDETLLSPALVPTISSASLSD